MNTNTFSCLYLEYSEFINQTKKRDTYGNLIMYLHSVVYYTVLVIKI